MHVLVSTGEVAAFAEDHRRAGRRVALVVGAFDLLHPGHLRVLAGARALAETVVAAVLGDEAVAAAEGPGRPFMPAAERAEIVAALWSVDAVCLLTPSTGDELLRALRPDVLVTGPECRAWDPRVPLLVESLGGTVAHIDPEVPWSTELLIGRVRALPRPPASP